MAKFNLSTYLMVSVLLILSGILWILFSQIDQNYQYPTISPVLQKEQSEIIQRVYQLQTEIEAAPVQQQVSLSQLESVVDKQLEKAKLNPITIEPVNKPQPLQSELGRSYSQGNKYNDVWSTFPDSDYEPYYYLRNNPWSPDYNPGN